MSAAVVDAPLKTRPLLPSSIHCNHVSRYLAPQLATHPYDLEAGTQGRIGTDPAGCRNRTVAGGLAAGAAPHRIVAEQAADRTRAARILVDDCRAVSSAVIDTVKNSPVPRGRQASR